MLYVVADQNITQSSTLEDHAHFCGGRVHAGMLADMFMSCRWVGVLTSYILRPSPASTERHAGHRRNHSWASPVVGVHIRRTDKITSGEAKLHSVTEYMSHVERYCDWKLGSNWQQHGSLRTPVKANHSAPATEAVNPDGRRCAVYLATDDPSVVQEVTVRYPHIHVITNPVALATGAEPLLYGVSGTCAAQIHLAHR